MIICMKKMGVDLGTKNIGIAITDELGTMAFPYGVIDSKDNSAETLLGICHKESVSVVVFGKTESQNEKIVNLRESISDFLQKEGIQTAMIDESFTSMHSSFFVTKNIFNSQKQKKEYEKKDDSKAATLLLQRYLEKNSKK